jgi:hypothetical protein
VPEHLQTQLWSRAKTLESARASALASATSDTTNGLPVLALMLARRLRRVSAELSFLEDLCKSYEEWRASRAEVATAERAADDTHLAAPARASLVSKSQGR